jgi:opacity protein-like surface antigen
MRKFTIAAASALALVSTAALAAVTFDSTTGTGFVGKGDVQLALGLNNAQLQAATLNFTYDAAVVTERSWVCTKDNGNTQERQRTTTSTTTGVVAAAARVKNQITGYNLNGFSSSSSNVVSTDGPALNSCPTHWELTTPAGDPEVISSTGGLFVNGAQLQ